VFLTGLSSEIAIVVTFLATLFLPIAAEVGIGVALSLLLQLNKEAMDLAVVELLPRDDGRFEEWSAPVRLTSRTITRLDVYGSLYAGSRTLQAKLPDPADGESPVVVLRLRGRTALGATAFVVVDQYAQRLGAVGGRLYLSGVDPELLRQMRQVDVRGPVRVFEETPIVGESTADAYREAEVWLSDREES
jgi:sulfate permease, SulP family